MKLGAGIFPTGESIPPAELAALAEQRGLDSLWFPEHTHIPTSRETPYPAGGELPLEYSRTLDPFVALAFAAGGSEQLLLGFGVCLVIERDPIITAKEVATLDLLSGGRVLFGVGAGWNIEEMRDHGTEPERRFRLMRERVEAMRSIWTQDEASYHGELVDFDPIWCWPKPLQPGGPPVLIGGNGPGVIDRVLRYGDAWLPNAVGDPDKLRARIAGLPERARAAGREPPGVTVFSVPRDADELRRYGEAGAERAVSWVPSGPRERTERSLDRLAALAPALA